MTDEPIRHLRHLASRDPAFLDDVRRCRAALLDLCPQHEAEVNVLTAAHRMGVVDRLLAAQQQSEVSRMPLEHLAAPIVKDIEDRWGIATPNAIWAVYAWGAALGVEGDLLSLRRPVILGFNAEHLPKEDLVRLSWSVLGENYDLRLEPGARNVTGTSYVDLHPEPGSQRYTLVATNGQGRTEQAVVVEGARTRVDYFTAERTVVAEGSSVKLRWHVSDASRVTILPDLGEVSPSGEHEIPAPASDVTYTLKAEDPGGGSTSEHLQIKVARIDRFEPAPHDGPLFGASHPRLRWSATHFERLELENVGDVTGRTEASVPESHRDITYTLIGFTSTGETVRRTLRLKAANLRRFEVEPRRVLEGGEVKLRWRLSNAQRVFVEGIGEVTGKRSLPVTASRSRKSWTIVLVGESNIVKRTVEVDVRSMPPAPPVDVAIPRVEAPALMSPPPRLQLEPPGTANLTSLVAAVSKRLEMNALQQGAPNPSQASALTRLVNQIKPYLPAHL